MIDYPPFLFQDFSNVIPHLHDPSESYSNMGYNYPLQILYDIPVKFSYQESN